MGNILFDGILSDKLKKFEKYVKNFKHVGQISFLKKNNVSNKLEIGMVKIPVIY